MNTQASAPDTTKLVWFKSSYSAGDGGDCVEVAAADTSVHIRDSKHSGGPVLRVGAVQWTTFVRMAARG